MKPFLRRLFCRHLEWETTNTANWKCNWKHKLKFECRSCGKRKYATGEEFYKRRMEFLTLMKTLWGVCRRTQKFNTKITRANAGR